MTAKFNHRNKIGEFKYDNIKNVINNIKNNTISEIDAKKNQNTLNKIKNVETIMYKKRTTKHKELLNLFYDLSDIILTDKTLELENQEDKNKNEREKVESRKEENKKVENENEDDYENKYEDYENEDDDETMDQNKKNKIIKGLNDNLDKIIDKSKSFEDQIELFKKLEDLKEYFPYKDFGDKELKSKYFKIQLAHMSNEIDEK